VTLDGVLDWILKLLTNYRSKLQISIPLSLISTLYQSLQHTLSLFCMLSIVFSWQRILTQQLEVSINYTLQISLELQHTSSLLFTLSTEHSKSESCLHYDWRFTANQFVLASSPLRPTTNTSHHTQGTFLYECPLHWILSPHKILITELCSSVVYSSSTVAIFTSEISLWTCTCASATYTVMSWTVLLASDTHRKLITSITAVLLPFVAYLLTLPRAL
jgi:hypothetical protein